MLVSNRGIAASCNVFPKKIISDTRDFHQPDYSTIQDGDTVYVVTSTLLSFITSVLPRLEKDGIRITLVTGAADTGAPREISERDKIDYLNVFSMSPVIVRWFAQNYDLPTGHDFVHPVPLGLDFHTLADQETAWGPKASPDEQNAQLLKIAAESIRFENRLNKSFSCYGFKIFRNRHQGDRILANQALKSADFNDVLPQPVDRITLWKKMAEYQFIISPHGSGLDCHRTYEALALGCIPVVRSSPLDILYQKLPVIVLPSWSDISIDLLQDEAEKVRYKGRERLALQYWVDQINGND